MIILDLGKVSGKPLEIHHCGEIPPTYVIEEFEGPWDPWNAKPFDPVPIAREVTFELQAIEGPTMKSPAVAFYRRKRPLDPWRTFGRHNRP